MSSNVVPTTHAKGNGSNSAAGARAPVHNLSVSIASGDAVDVRSFRVRELMSGLFEAKIVGVCENADIDFDAVAGQTMRFLVHGRAERAWTGVCSDLQQIAVEEQGLSTYEITLVPALWLLTQRRNYRIFQQMSEIDIVRKLLGEWGIAPTLKLSGAYKKRNYRVQYGETDYAFF